MKKKNLISRNAFKNWFRPNNKAISNKLLSNCQLSLESTLTFEPCREKMESLPMRK